MSTCDVSSLLLLPLVVMNLSTIQGSLATHATRWLIFLALAFAELTSFVCGTFSGSTRLFHEDLVTVQREHTAPNDALFFDVSHLGDTVAIGLLQTKISLRHSN